MISSIKISFDDEEESDVVLGFSSLATDNTKYYVFINADIKTREVTLSDNLTSATVIVDDDEAGATAVSTPSGFTLTSTKITLEPLTAVVIMD